MAMLQSEQPNIHAAIVANPLLFMNTLLGGGSNAGEHSHDHEHEHGDGEMKGDASTAAYICPMGDGWGDKPGPCPGCGMEMASRR